MHSLSFVKTFVFDLDDTLYDELQFVEGGTKAVLEWLAVRYNFKINSLNRIMGSIIRGFPRNEWYQRLMEKIGIPIDQKTLNEMVKIYRNHLPNLRLFPDAKRFLRKVLEKNNVMLGIITDGIVSVQKLKVKSLGLEKIMDLIIYTWSRGIRYQKPHSWAFEYIEKKTNSYGRECCYIGNDPCKDFLAPNRLGWTTIYIHRRKTEKISIPLKEYMANIEIYSFDEIHLK